MNEAGRKAFQALREADESRRADGTVMNRGGKVCACGVMAKSLGIKIWPGKLTDELILEMAEAMDVSAEQLENVPFMNDAGAPDAGNAYLYSWREIADHMETLINAG